MSAASESLIYFDNNATTCVAPEVFEAMTPFLTEQYGNPSSAYSFGKRAKEAVATARDQVASLLKCNAREVVFTSCGTESDNFAIMSALQTTGKRHVITTQVEHSAIMKFGDHLEQQGYGVTWLGVDREGALDLEELENSIRDDTAIVSIMLANNETGVLFPIKEIAEICQRKGVLFHTDAVQTPGKLDLHMDDLGVNFASFSGHKLHAPKGVGALYVKLRTRTVPYVMGGGQERGKRGGTENVASLVGLGKAAELAQANLEDEQTRVRDLRDRLEKELTSTLDNTFVVGGTNPHGRLPNTTNICFEGAEAEGILMALDENGICASAGSACTTGSLEPSHVLTAMGLTPDQARSCVRLSLSHFNTGAEVDKVLGLLPGIVQKLRSMSPAG